MPILFMRSFLIEVYTISLSECYTQIVVWSFSFNLCNETILQHNWILTGSLDSTTLSKHWLYSVFKNTAYLPTNFYYLWSSFRSDSRHVDKNGGVAHFAALWLVDEKHVHADGVNKTRSRCVRTHELRCCLGQNRCSSTLFKNREYENIFFSSKTI